MLTIPLTPEQFQLQKAKVEAELKQSLASDKGTIAHEGVVLSYTYDGKTLAVNVVKKPMLMPMALINSKITSWFATA